MRTRCMIGAAAHKSGRCQVKPGPTNTRTIWICELCSNRSIQENKHPSDATYRIKQQHHLTHVEVGNHNTHTET